MKHTRTFYLTSRSLIHFLSLAVFLFSLNCFGVDPAAVKKLEDSVGIQEKQVKAMTDSQKKREEEKKDSVSETEKKQLRELQEQLVRDQGSLQGIKERLANNNAAMSADKITQTTEKLRADAARLTGKINDPTNTSADVTRLQTEAGEKIGQANLIEQLAKLEIPANATPEAPVSPSKHLNMEVDLTQKGSTTNVPFTALDGEG